MASRALPVLLFAPFFLLGCGGGMDPASAPESEDGFFSLLSTPPHHFPPPPAPIPKPERTFGTCVGQPSKGHRARPPPRIWCCYTDPSLFRGYINKKSSDMRTCYEEALARDPSVQGRVVSKFTIEEDGSVMRACDAGSTVGDPKLVECVLRVMTTVTFMAFTEADPCPPPTITYPIMFSPTPVE
jgi:hypothetical protein